MLPVGLSSYAFAVAIAHGPRPEGASFVPWGVEDLIDRAAEWGLSSVELPAQPFVDQPALVSRARNRLAERGLHCAVFDGGLARAEQVRPLLPIAAALGASTLRVVLSNVLCGERRQMGGRWPVYLEEMAGELRAVRADARDSGVVIAVENHQDLDSRDLVWLCETVGSDMCGVCLDTGNPLAVAEDVAAFTRRVGPFLRAIHLKDYRVYASSQGYRLARCALGQGALDWPALFALLDEAAPGCAKAIELGATQARHVCFLEDSYWPDYRLRPMAEILPVLRLRDACGRPAGEDWRTPHERGEPADARRTFEVAEMDESVRYLRTILPEGARR